MKKLMIGLVGAVALCASAQAEVASENIVGFDTKDIVAGNFNMYSVPFKTPGGTGFSLNANLTIANATAGALASESDQIQIWNAETSGYEYWYLYEGDDEYPYGWYQSGGDEESFDVIYPNGLPTGTAFWYLAKNTSSDAEVTFAGEVDNAVSKSFTLVKGNFNMLANPYPEAFNINTDLALEGATAGALASESDQIQIWNAETSGYEYWYLYEGDDEYPYGWYQSGGDEESFDVIYPKGLPAGTAFWYLAKEGTGTIQATFTK